MLPAAISVSSENDVSNLTTHSYSPDRLPTDDHNTLRVMNKDEPYSSRLKIGYCCRKHGRKYATKRQGSIAPHDLMNTRDFIIVVVFTG